MGGNQFADHVNAMTGYVVASQPVDTSGWDPTVVIPGADLIDEVRRLEGNEGGDVIIWGAGRLTDDLAAAGLLDEYRICTAPVIRGWGPRCSVRPAPPTCGSSAPRSSRPVRWCTPTSCRPPAELRA